MGEKYPAGPTPVYPPRDFTCPNCKKYHSKPHWPDDRQKAARKPREDGGFTVPDDTREKKADPCRPSSEAFRVTDDGVHAPLYCPHCGWSEEPERVVFIREPDARSLGILKLDNGRVVLNTIDRSGRVAALPPPPDPPERLGEPDDARTHHDRQLHERLRILETFLSGIASDKAPDDLYEEHVLDISWARRFRTWRVHAKRVCNNLGIRFRPDPREVVSVDLRCQICLKPWTYTGPRAALKSHHAMIETLRRLVADAVFQAMHDSDGFHWPPCPEESDMCGACNVYWRAKALGITSETLENLPTSSPGDVIPSKAGNERTGEKVAVARADPKGEEAP